MDSSNADARLIASFVSYALAKALFERLIGQDRMHAANSALSFLPPEPDPSQDPALHASWKAAQRELKELGEIE